MVEWNRIFRLFRFSGILGQPREVHPKFRNEIPENVCSIRFHTFPEFLVEWKALTVAKVTYCVAKMIPTHSPMVGQVFDTVGTDKEWL